MGNKVALALMLLATSTFVGACGGTQGGADEQASTGPVAHRIRTGPTDPDKSCTAQQIDKTHLRPGSCTEEGVHYVVANYGGAVKLKSLTATVVEVSVSGGFRGGTRTVAPRYDAFLRMKLQVQNRGKAPQRFETGQTMLGIGADNYLERADVERKYDPEALVNTSGGRVGPGETLRGDVIYDITREDYEQLQRVGRFFIWNFGGRANARISRSNGQVGQIRLYAVEGN
ncbi:MAG TPA: DUF4352 domain-containing protein [Conexibacter sp.]|nr:DUF4352 domain-containing protein [Conexibacter sp.]